MTDVQNVQQKGKDLLNLIAGSSMKYEDKVEAGNLVLAIQTEYNELLKGILTTLQELKTQVNANKR